MKDVMPQADASEVLGSPQLAGLWIQPRNAAKQMVGRVAGGVVGSALTGEFKDGPEGTPDFGKVAFLALTASEVALVGAKTGLFKPKLGQPLARVDKGQVLSAKLGEDGTLAFPMSIAFTNGATWDFEVPRARRERAAEFVAQFPASPSL